MDTVMVFSLLLLYNDFSQKGVKNYGCSLKNITVPENTRSISIILHELQNEEKRVGPYQKQMIAALKCSAHRHPVEVDLIYSEQHRTATGREPCSRSSLQNLVVRSVRPSRPQNARFCSLYSSHTQKHETGHYITGRVFLSGVSNCAVSNKSPGSESLKEETPSPVAKGNPQKKTTTEVSDAGLLLRQQQALYIKVAIFIFLFTASMIFIVFFIFEAPC
uniref:Uncharacterized protein n=1 Tax=Latimeria chalumnae TaxID=7897 RepID=H3BFZ1_LATCH